MQKLKQWFDGLNPTNKRKAILAGVGTLLIGAVLLFVLSTDGSDRPAPSTNKRKKVETSVLTGKDPNKIGIEAQAASIKRLESESEDLKRQLLALRNQLGGQKDAGGANSLPFPYKASQGEEVVAADGGHAVARPDGGGSVNAPAIAPVTAPPKAIADALGSNNTDTVAPPPGGRLPTKGRAMPEGLPPPNIPGMPTEAGATDVFGDNPIPVVQQPSPPPPPPKPQLRVLEPRSSGKVRPVESHAASSSTYTPAPGPNGRGQARAGRSEPEFYLPMGSIISGTLLTGVDAPASGQHARKDPFPSLLRIKHEALLPNNGLLDIRDCLLIASAYGDLSSERVYMRAEGLSCQRGDGAIIEASIDAYASGSDGKAGISGRVVEKTGQLVARSLAAGFVEGLASAFKPQKTNAVRVNPVPGQKQDFQYPDPSFIVGSGVLGGAAEAAGRIGSIYDELAKQIVPVIEVNAGIPMDFIMTRGVTLRFKKVGEISGASARSNPVHPPQQHARNDQVTTSLTGTVGGGFSVTPGQGGSTPAPTPTGPSATFVGGRR